MVIGDCRRSAKTVSATGLGQESGRGRARVSGNPVLMETGVRADHSSPGIYLDIYTGYLLPVIYLDISTVYLLPGYIQISTQCIYCPGYI